jgi:hypothetical protein
MLGAFISAVARRLPLGDQPGHHMKGEWPALSQSNAGSPMVMTGGRGKKKLAITSITDLKSSNTMNRNLGASKWVVDMRKTAALTIVLLMMSMPFGQALAWDDAGSSRGPSPFDEGVLWEDTLDSMTNVYVPPGGLVGVEVSGGNAHLQAGHDQGWIASAAIT